MAGLGDALRRPWRSSAIWIVLQAMAVWTVVCIVLLNVNLNVGGPDTQMDNWVKGALAISWLLFLLRYLTVCAAPPTTANEVPYNVDFELWRQCFAMAHFAMTRGKTPDKRDLTAIQELAQATDWNIPSPDRVAVLADAHKRLSKLVAPALPKTIVLLSNFEAEAPTATGDVAPPTRRQESFIWLGNVRVARMMLGLAVALLPIFIALALFKGTSLDSADGLFVGDFQDKSATAIYLIVASALGASFAALFKVRKYVEHLNYDDQYESSYWVRFVLGLVAGMILAVLFAALVPNDENTQFRITVPILALVGGFSSDLVYRILKRIIDSIETLLEGSASEAIETERRQAEARLREQELDANQHLAEKVWEGRNREIANLLSLLETIPAGEPGDAARALLTERLVALVEETETDGEPSSQVTADSTDGTEGTSG